MGRVRIKNGRRLRALVVDDSVVIRKLVSSVLDGQPGIEVVGTAANGSIALQKISQVNPDVVTLDVEMPQMDGLETLKHIRKTHPQLVVIMFSTLTSRGASATMDALSLGANDYVTKASNSGSLDRSMDSLRQELVPKIRQFFEFEGEQPVAAVAASAVPRPVEVKRPAVMAGPRVTAVSLAPKILAIGVSTGGPTALAEVIPRIPKGFPLPIVIVQHMPPMFTALLADRLAQKSKIPVVEAKDGVPLQQGTAYLAPGDFHLALKRRGTAVVCTLNRDPPENSCRPAVDVLFRSVEEVYGGAALAVILTGMGQDGLRGAELLRGSGARVLAQDEASSVVWGMPGAVVRAGLADSVLPLQAMVPEILRRANV
jgi:two-component system, chemotaxis family, protein-glutamate methylesterase/glutaminase